MKDTSDLGYSQLKWIGGKGSLSSCFLNMHSDKAVICVIYYPQNLEKWISLHIDKKCVHFLAQRANHLLQVVDFCSWKF